MSQSISAFDLCFANTLGHEGGYTNNPSDPGGETNWGISKRAYPNVDIANLTQDQAKAIYKSDYWDKISGDTLHPALACITFDAAVNNGVGSASRWLQTAVGATPDGSIGPATRAAIQKADPVAAMNSVHAQRIMFMAGLDTWGTFGKGWSARLAALPYQASQIALQMGVGGPA
jgi:lysozyme family protein